MSLSDTSRIAYQQARCPECGHKLGDWARMHEPGCKTGEAFARSMQSSQNNYDSAAQNILAGELYPADPAALNYQPQNGQANESQADQRADTARQRETLAPHSVMCSQINAAVLAERERCVQVACDVGLRCHDRDDRLLNWKIGYFQAAIDIAEAIRRPL